MIRYGIWKYFDENTTPWNSVILNLEKKRRGVNKCSSTAAVMAN